MKKKVLTLTLLCVTGYVSAGWFDWVDKKNSKKESKQLNTARPNISRESNATPCGFFNVECHEDCKTQCSKKETKKEKCTSSKCKSTKCASGKKCKQGSNK